MRFIAFLSHIAWIESLIMIHVSSDTADIIKDKFPLENRGIVEVKGKGPMETYLLNA